MDFKDFIPQHNFQAPNSFKAIAFMPVFNEEDILESSIKKLLDNGISVYVLENWSTDNSFEILSKIKHKNFLGFERFPKDGPSKFFDWGNILEREEALCEQLNADWYLQYDADNIKVSPWKNLKLIDSIYFVDQIGYNAIDFLNLQFQPIDNNFNSDKDFETYFQYFEFSKHGANKIQIQAWKNSGQKISFSSTGGHEILFDERKVFPFKFILKHYPIRSQNHGEKKILQERQKRWNPQERKKDWHNQYNHIDVDYDFIKTKSELTLFDDTFYENYSKNKFPNIDIVSEMYSDAEYKLSPINLSNPKNAHDFQLVLTGKNKKVLELGPASGYISKILKENSCHVTAIELDVDDAKTASKIVDKMIIGNIEQLDLKKELCSEKFDVILAGDVLEHLVNPQQILQKLSSHLNPSGYIVCSMPNISHGSIRLKLLNGGFDYTQTGLLDKTHLGFFTLKTILELFESSGYSIIELKKVKTDIFAADGADIDTSQIHGDLIQSLLNDPSATTFQYVFRAISSSNTHNQEILDDEDLHTPTVVTKYLKEHLDDYYDQIDTLQNLTSEKATEIESLQTAVESLQTAVEGYQTIITDIHQSFVFRMLHKYDKTIGKIFPLRPKKYIKSTQQQSTTEEQKIHTKKSLDIILKKKDIICFPIINWDFRFQRPQHILTEFAKKGHRVFYLTTNLRQLKKPYEIKTLANNIFQIELNSPKFFDIYKDKFNESFVSNLINQIKELQKDLKLDAISFVEFPTWEPLVLELRKQLGYPVIFDCLDDFTGFNNIIKERENEEKILLKKSDLTLVTSSYLLKKAMKETSRFLFLPNAGEFEHFNKSKDRLLKYKKPIIGYFGSISDWFDTDLIEYLASKRSQFTFVLIGQTYGADIRKLQEFTNVHFLGERPYSELPKYLCDFDVCLIPFKMVPLVDATHPVKIYEYFAAGKPVVATTMTELYPMADMCYLAKNKEDFLEKIDLAVNEKDETIVNKRIKFSSENTWEDRFKTLYNELKKIDSFDIEHHS